jgi:hypothetical protein
MVSMPFPIICVVASVLAAGAGATGVVVVFAVVHEFEKGCQLVAVEILHELSNAPRLLLQLLHFLRSL